MDPTVGRSTWAASEPSHDLIYFVPVARAATDVAWGALPM